MRGLINGSLLFIVCAISQSVCAQEIERIVDPYFSAYDHSDSPGAAVGVIKDGRLIYAKGYGQAHLEEDRAVTPTTNFRLASLSKAFTATAVMVLVQDGTLQLDQSLGTMVEDFPEYGRRIKLRHLLSHTAGLHDYEDLIPSSQTEPVLDADVVEILKNETRTYFTPGTQYRYSNAGYAVLAHIVAVVSGQTYQDFLQEHVLNPLGLTRSIAFVNGVNEVEERAYGYTLQGGQFRFTDQSMTSAVLGDGGVYSSIMDLFRWDQSWYGVNPVLTDASISLMTSKQKLENGQSIAYGFGWVVDSYAGHKRLSHTGSTIGQRHAIQRIPDLGLSVIVLVNRANVSPWDTAGSIMSRMIERL